MINLPYLISKSLDFIYMDILLLFRFRKIKLILKNLFDYLNPNVKFIKNNKK